MLTPVLVTPPVEPVVSTAEAKAHLRVEHADEDVLIAALVKAATDHLDGWTGILGRALVTQVWRLDADWFGYPIRLPLAPVQSTGLIVAYSDAANADQVVPAADYALLTDALGPYVELVSGASWPSVYSRRDAVRVTFTAGYGAASAVPEPIKQAIKLLVGHWYENRSAVVAGTAVTSVPVAFDALISSFRRWRI